MMANGPPQIFDRQALARARSRAGRIGGDTFIVREAVEGLAERLAVVTREFDRAVSLDGPHAARALLLNSTRPWAFVELGADETIDLAPASADLVVSVLALHTVNDLPGVLAQIRRALRPDGLFLAAMLGGSTLIELRRSIAAGEAEVLGGASPRIAPFADIRELGGLLQRTGFALPVADVERTIARYRDAARLIADLRALGETSVLTGRTRRSLSRPVWNATASHYMEHYADADGRLRATFDTVYLTGWAPHESQQKPLAPGSAKARLADALGTKERSAGEAADPRKPR